MRLTSLTSSQVKASTDSLFVVHLPFWRFFVASRAALFYHSSSFICTLKNALWGLDLFIKANWFCQFSCNKKNNFTNRKCNTASAYLKSVKLKYCSTWCWLIAWSLHLFLVECREEVLEFWQFFSALQEMEKWTAVQQQRAASQLWLDSWRWSLCTLLVSPPVMEPGWNEMMPACSLVTPAWFCWMWNFTSSFFSPDVSYF